MAMALLGAACSSADGGADETTTELATLQTDTGGASGDDALAASTTSTEPDAEVDLEEALLAFAACMRETYPNWPDPDLSDGVGRFFDPQALQDAGVDLTGDGFREARQTCEEENLQGVAGQTPERTPEEQAELEDNLLALFACARETPGFEDLPDPDVSGGQGFGLRELFQDGRFDPVEFRDVMQACQTDLGIEGPGRPGGRGSGGDQGAER